MSAKAMRKMADKVKAMLPSDFGFTIIVFPFNKPGISNYISNANRSDMIKCLRETADRIEQNQDFETPEIYCIEGSLFDDIERYYTLEEDENRINELLI